MTYLSRSKKRLFSKETSLQILNFSCIHVGEQQTKEYPQLVGDGYSERLSHQAIE